jgi:hypothetical protein
MSITLEKLDRITGGAAGVCRGPGAAPPAGWGDSIAASTMCLVSSPRRM